MTIGTTMQALGTPPTPRPTETATPKAIVVATLYTIQSILADKALPRAMVLVQVEALAALAWKQAQLITEARRVRRAKKGAGA